MPINENVIDAVARLMDAFVTAFPEEDLTAEAMADYANATQCPHCWEWFCSMTGAETLDEGFERVWASEVWRAFVARLEARGGG